MTALIRQIEERLEGRKDLLRELAPAGIAIAALLLARWWSLEYVPTHFRSLWGPYFLGPLGWSLAAATGFYAYRQTRQPVLSERPVDQPTVVMFAAVVGVFIVATQIVLGMFSNFGISPFNHSPKWLLINGFFAGSTLVAVEVSRAVILRILAPKSLTLALLITSAGLVAVPLTVSQFTKDGLVDQVQFWGSIFLPMAATGLVAGFFVLYGGLRAGLLVSAPIVAFQYLSPILPVADWPMLALAGVAGPAVGLWIAEGLFAEDEDEEQTGFRLPSVAWSVTAVMALTIFWFSFGFFGYKPMFVPSTSMVPSIERGDVVLLGPVDPGKIKVGDVILYTQGERTRVLHRVVEIKPGENGERTFIFKGDANNTEDLLPVTEDQLIGRYVTSVPKIGWLPMQFQEELGEAPMSHLNSLLRRPRDARRQSPTLRRLTSARRSWSGLSAIVLALAMGCVALSVMASANTLWSQDLKLNVDPITVSVGLEGCSPGYWKNHKELWDGQPFDYTGWVTKTLKFNQTFGVSSTQSGFSNWEKLYDVVKAGGGGKIALARHAAAHLANADAKAEGWLPGYPYTTSEVIAIYRSAIVSPTTRTIDQAKAQFEAAQDDPGSATCDLGNGPSNNSLRTLGSQTFAVESLDTPALTSFEIWAGIGDLPPIPAECAGMTFDKVIVLDEEGGEYESAELRDLIFGSENADAIRAGAGEDCIVGNGGDDQLFGQDGNDVFLAGSARDMVWGGLGDDIIDGGTGSDLCTGNEGANRVSACEPASAPQGVQVTPDPINQLIALSWLANNDAVLYNVYVSTTPGAPDGSTVLLGASVTPEYAHLAPTPDVTFYYRVTYLDADGFESQLSTPVSAFVTAPLTPTASPSPSPSPTATPTPLATTSPTVSPSPTATPATASPVPSATPSATAVATKTPAPTETQPAATSTHTPAAPTATPTATAIPAATTSGEKP